MPSPVVKGIRLVLSKTVVTSATKEAANDALSAGDIFSF